MGSMRSMLLLLFAVLTTTQASAAPHVADEQSAAIAKAGKLFEANCVACHQVPDTRFAIDRVWLKQVESTA